ncbi:MAG: hypothetical protein LBR39_07690, partial [Coriobacteriales bacterium]|nr:hypothetical protein [Coriobacteriales bacterium]
LNPAKISGACGRLMCCLRYEFEAYKDFKSRAPRKGSLIETPLGAAKVVDFDTPREVVTMRLEDGKMLSIPLREFECDCDENGCSKPCRVSREAVNRCASSSILLALGALEREQELLSEIADGRRQAADTRTPRRTERKRRERGADKGAAGDGAASSGRRARPARGDAETDSESTTSSEARRRPRQRPGQRSSGLRRTSGGQRSSQGSPASGGQSAGSSQSRQSQSAGGDSKSTGDRRRRRRRSSGGGSGSSPGASSGAGRDSSSGTSSGATS